MEYRRNYFFVNGKKCWTYLRSLTAGDIKELGGVPLLYPLCEETDDDEHPFKFWGDGEAIDLAGSTRHFMASPPATM